MTGYMKILLFTAEFSKVAFIQELLNTHDSAVIEYSWEFKTNGSVCRKTYTLLFFTVVQCILILSKSF
jgi:hypothetical protein